MLCFLGCEENTVYTRAGGGGGEFFPLPPTPPHLLKVPKGPFLPGFLKHGKEEKSLGLLGKGRMEGEKRGGGGGVVSSPVSHATSTPKRSKCTMPTRVFNT